MFITYESNLQACSKDYCSMDKSPSYRNHLESYSLLLFLLFYSLNNDRYWKHLSREFINRNCSPVRSGCICDHSILASIYHKLSEENDNFCISVNGISTAA